MKTNRSDLMTLNQLRPQDPAVLFLCEAASGQRDIDRIRQQYNQIQDDQLWEAARANGMLSVAAHLLLEAFGTSNVPERWRLEHDKTSRRISSYLAELDRIAARLASENVPLIALKNGGIARGIYPCAGCCPMGDLDVLVLKRDFQRAHKILLSEGYQFEFRSPLEIAELGEAERGGGTEYWKQLSDGEKMWFELQWRPIAGRWIRPDQEPTAEDLFDASISIPDTQVRLLSPEDNLVQIALHTAKHSYVRAPGFRLHTDVDRVTRFQTIDWGFFVEKVSRLQVKTAVYFSLVIPSVMFNTPIPQDVLTQLRPTRWKEWLISKWLRRVGLFNPAQPKFSRIGYIGFTILLYDDLGGLLRALFPEPAWMRQKYAFTGNLSLAYYYGRRLFDLAFKRTLT